MQDMIKNYIDSLRHDVKRRRRFVSLLCVLSFIVAGCVTWSLHIVGITLANDIDYVSDPNADVETAEIWEATLPESEAFTGVWAYDTVSVARSQLGYKESWRNYIIDEYTEEKRGYTRYGEWYGNKYGDWSAMFVAFCLHYADVPEQLVPWNSGVFALLSEMKAAGLYIPAASFSSAERAYIPNPGDIVFLKDASFENVNRAGIVSGVREDGISVIEGGSDDTVAEYIYAPDDSAIAGYTSVAAAQEGANGVTGRITEPVLDESVLKEQLSALLVLFDEKAAAYFEAAQLPDLTPARAIKLEMSRLYNNAFGLYLLLFPDAGETDFAACLKSEHPASYEAYEAARGLPMTDPVFTEPLNGEKVFRVYDGAKFTVDFTLRGEIVFPVKDSASRVNARKYWEGVRAELITPAVEIRAAFEALTANEEDEACELAVLEAAFFYGEEALDISGCEIIVTAAPKIDTSSKVTEEEETELIFRAWQREQSGEITALTASETYASHSAGGAAVFALSPGSSVAVKAISVKSVADPEITVDYWGNVVVPDLSDTQSAQGADGHILPLLNTDTADGLGGIWNGRKLNNPMTYLNVKFLGGDKYKIVFKTNFLKLYKEHTYKLNVSPGVEYVNTVGDNYVLKSLTVYEGGYDPDAGNNANSGFARRTYGPTDNYDRPGYTDLAHAVFVTDSAIESAANNMIYIEDGWAVRLNYDPIGRDTTIYEDRDAEFWDYHITCGKVQNLGGGLSWDTRWWGINNYQTTGRGTQNDSAVPFFSFGNANSGVKYEHLAKRDGSGENSGYMNHGNNNTTGHCCFAILDPDDHTKIRSGWGALSGASVDYLYNGTPLSGKIPQDGYGLRFQQRGDFFSLVDYTYEGSAKNAQLETFTLRGSGIGTIPGGSQYANDFWPMDNVPYWVAAGHGNNQPGAASTAQTPAWADPKWGWPQDVYFYGANKAQNAIIRGKFPASDDKKYDHNTLFGMNIDIPFELPKDYVGPLNYIFFGDDDLWVYLQYPDGTEKLVCDLGGVHLTMGEYVNLRNYLPNGSSGHYRLHVMYNERGNSGSTCYMSFCLPNPGVPVTQKGEAWLDKEIKGFHNINDKFEFKFDIYGGTPEVQTGDKFPYYIYSPVCDADGNVTTSGYDVFKDGGSPSRVGTVQSGGYIYLGHLEFVRVLNLPPGAHVDWTETKNDYFDTGYKYQQVNVNQSPHPDVDWSNCTTHSGYTDWTTIKIDEPEYIERFVNTVKIPPKGEVWLEKEVTDIHNYVPDDAEFTFKLDIDYTGFVSDGWTLHNAQKGYLAYSGEGGTSYWPAFQTDDVPSMYWDYIAGGKIVNHNRNLTDWPWLKARSDDDNNTHYIDTVSSESDASSFVFYEVLSGTGAATRYKKVTALTAGKECLLAYEEDSVKYIMTTDYESTNYQPILIPVAVTQSDSDGSFTLGGDYDAYRLTVGGDYEPANYTYYIYDSYDDFVANPEPEDNGYSSTGVVLNHGTIKLKDGQFARVTGIPLDARTTWTEESVTINGVTTTMTADDTDNWWTWYKWDFVYLNGDLPAAPDWSGEYLGNTDYWYVYEDLAFFDHFRNDYVGEDLHTDEIWLEKKVEPENEPCDDEFTFTLTLTDVPDGASYTWYKYNSYDDFYNNRPHAETGTITSGGTVKLKKDQFVRVVGLPAGSGYTWTETVPAGYETPVVTTNSYYCEEVTAVSEIVQGGYYLLGAEFDDGLYIMGTDVENADSGRYPSLHKVTADDTGNKLKISASDMTRDWALYAKSSGGKYSFRNGAGFLAFDTIGYPIFSGTLDDYSKWYVTPVSGESGVFCFQNYEWQNEDKGHEDGCEWIYGYEGSNFHMITFTSSEANSKLKLYRITVPEAYQTVTNTFTNTRKKYPVNLEKRSMTADGAAVAGAKFKLEAADAGWAALSQQPNGFPKTAESAADGKINFTDILPGNYLLTETEAPDGYYLAAAPWHITVAADGAVTVRAKNGTSGNYEAVPVNGNTPVIINMTSYELPSTGGTGILPYTFGGLLLAAIPLMYFGYCTRRKKKGGGKI